MVVAASRALRSPIRTAPARSCSRFRQLADDRLLGVDRGRVVMTSTLPAGVGSDVERGGDRCARRGAAGVVQLGEVGGQGHVVELAAVEPGVEPPQRPGVGAAGVLADGGLDQAARRRRGRPDRDLLGVGPGGRIIHVKGQLSVIYCATISSWIPKKRQLPASAGTRLIFGGRGDEGSQVLKKTPVNIGPTEHPDPFACSGTGSGERRERQERPRHGTWVS